MAIFFSMYAALASIGSGKWSKDQRLPSENELVSALGVSRMTVHRALRELTSEGYLLRVQGVGTVSAPSSRRRSRNRR